MSRRRLALVLGIAVLASAAYPRTPLAPDDSSDRFVHGRVVDGRGPLADATVRWKGTDHHVVTDASGKFRLPNVDGATRVTAWKEGYFIAGTDPGDAPLLISLRPIPRGDDPNYDWVDPSPDPEHEDGCGNCHVETYRQWVSSAHGGAAVNRRFLGVFYGTDWQGETETGWSVIRDQPEARAVCAACHLPTVDPADPEAADPARAEGVTREGIHCDYCHKIADVDLARIGVAHGRAGHRLVRPPRGEQVFFGPLDDVDRGRDTFAAVYGSSSYCASCHEGTLFGIPAYTTWSEWKESRFAAAGVQCQDCHMKPDGRTVNSAPGHGGIDRDPNGLSTHHFPGSRDDASLKSSVRMDVTVTGQAGQVEVEVGLRSREVGHAFPTGSPDRHLILLVEAFGRDGKPQPLIAGGRIGPEGGIGSVKEGDLAGRPGKVYAKRLEGEGGLVPAPFWNASIVRSDNRLRPGRVDRTRHAFRTGGSGEVRVTLRYRTMYREVSKAKRWPDRDVVLAERSMRYRIPDSPVGAFDSPDQ